MVFPLGGVSEPPGRAVSSQARWSHTRVSGTCPSWPRLCLATSGELPQVLAKGTGTKGATATQSVLQEVDEAGWEDTGAGAITLDEADPALLVLLPRHHDHLSLGES